MSNGESSRSTPKDRLDVFLARFEVELERRYKECPPTATPDSILLAVLNAVAEAKQWT